MKTVWQPQKSVFPRTVLNIERDEEGTFEVALGFYDYLNELPEEFLEEHDYSKEEVKEGAQSLADRKGLGLLGEGLD